MADRLEALKQLADAPVRPLPADEVRRRGDRLRVRRTALQALGAAAAVAVVVTGGVLATGSPESAPPPITRHTHAPAPSPEPPTPSPGQPEPTHTALTPPMDPVPATPPRIPEGLPLAAGWPPLTEHGPHDGLFGPSRAVKALRLGSCRRPHVDAERDRVTAMRMQPEDLRGRELSMFASVAAAQAYESTVVQSYLECPPDGNLPPVRWTEAPFPVHRADALPDGHVLLMTVGPRGAPAPGAESLIVIRNGAAVLVSEAFDEGMGLGTARRNARKDYRALSPVLDRLGALDLERYSGHQYLTLDHVSRLRRHCRITATGTDQTDEGGVHIGSTRLAVLATYPWAVPRGDDLWVRGRTNPRHGYLFTFSGDRVSGFSLRRPGC